MVDALATPISESNSDSLGELLFGDSRGKRDTQAHAALTFGDLLFDMAAIDPRVVEAADFIRTDDLGDGFSFSLFAERFQELSGRTAIGTGIQLRGYVAEQMVASRLVNLGHQVSFPEAANQPGFDLIVDGEPFQVKCGESLAIIKEHFDKYPDIPVLANDELITEVADGLPEMIDNVFAIEGFSLTSVEGVMADSIEAGSEMLDYEVAMFSAIILAGRGITDWWNGEIGIRDAIADLGVGLAAKSGLGAAGGLAGKAAGLAFFGPAGAVVFGGVAAVAAASQSRHFLGTIRDLTNRSVSAAARSASQKLVDSLIHGLTEKIRILEAKRAQTMGEGAAANFVRRRFDDQIAYCRERIAEAEHFDPNLKDARSTTLDAIDLARRSHVHLVKLQQQYRDLLRAIEEIGSRNKRWGFAPRKI